MKEDEANGEKDTCRVKKCRRKLYRSLYFVDVNILEFSKVKRPCSFTPIYPKSREAAHVRL